MLQSKLLKFLRALKKQPRDFREFEKFVSSPYFNAKGELVELLAYIKLYWKASEKQQEEFLGKKVAYKAIFPKEKKYKAWKMNESISDLSRLLENFLVMQQLRKNSHLQNTLMTDALRDRGMDDFYFKKIEVIEQEFSNHLEIGAPKTPVLYRNLLWVNEHVYYHPNHKTTNKENEQRLANIHSYLDLEYAIKKLQFACEVQSRKRIFGSQFSPLLLSEIRHISSEKFKDEPLLSAYEDILLLFETGDITMVSKLKVKLMELASISSFDKDFRRDIIYKFANALPDFEGRLSLYFELYAFLDSNDLLIEYGFIPPEHFSNIVHLGCVLKKEEWVQEFIQKNTRHLRLEKDKMENIQLLSKAQINFYKQAYNEAFSQLFNLKIEDMTYGLRYHTLLLRTIIKGKFAIKFRFDFEACCRNFKVYARRKYKRKEISKMKRDGCLQFVRMASAIYFWKHRKENKESLLEELDQSPEIPFHAWLKNELIKL